MNTTTRMYLSIVGIYLVVDVAYQAAFGLNNMTNLFEDAGIDDVMASEPQYVWTVPIFFLAIGYVLLRVAVRPAIQAGDVRAAVINGGLVGLAAYGTLAVVLLWTVIDYPPAAAAFVILEGLLFAPISSGATAWLFLRDRNDAVPAAERSPA